MCVAEHALYKLVECNGIRANRKQGTECATTQRIWAQDTQLDDNGEQKAISRRSCSTSIGPASSRRFVVHRLPRTGEPQHSKLYRIQGVQQSRVTGRKKPTAAKEFTSDADSDNWSILFATGNVHKNKQHILDICIYIEARAHTRTPNQ